MHNGSNSSTSAPVIGMSHKLFHLDAENEILKFRISLSVSDTVVITDQRMTALLGL